ncbi:hypothetical protein TNCV_3941171 [Trichonephila clavipes]|uniref:Uncharacterized protein n=1 Tax=Trichonephila clavipes TaxID=2585209 RepID=A0A8X6VVX3_TRICX|nr:hypothetical protein TNCV_3941171 [Trichonephila clavipes]
MSTSSLPSPVTKKFYLVPIAASPSHTKILRFKTDHIIPRPDSNPKLVDPEVRRHDSRCKLKYRNEKSHPNYEPWGSLVLGLSLSRVRGSIDLFFYSCSRVEPFNFERFIVRRSGDQIGRGLRKAFVVQSEMKK